MNREFSLEVTFASDKRELFQRITKIVRRKPNNTSNREPHRKGWITLYRVVCWNFEFRQFPAFRKAASRLIESGIPVKTKASFYDNDSHNRYYLPELSTEKKTKSAKCYLKNGKINKIIP